MFSPAGTPRHRVRNRAAPPPLQQTPAGGLEEAALRDLLRVWAAAQQAKKRQKRGSDFCPFLATCVQVALLAPPPRLRIVSGCADTTVSTGTSQNHVYYHNQNNRESSIRVT